jgi:DNA repair protein RadA/Sms
LEENNRGVAGSVISCIIEGTRPFLVDIQALVTKTIFGYPQRKASGFDLNRLQVLTAVLSKRQKVNLSSQDVILNVVGGLKISDPALDLAVCLAMVSSLLNLPIDRRMLVLGEVGLGGELRPVGKLEFRLKEAEKMGFTRVLIPEMKLDGLAKMKNMEIIKVKTLSEAVDAVGKK